MYFLFLFLFLSVGRRHLFNINGYSRTAVLFLLTKKKKKITRRLSQPHQHQKQQNFIHLETAEEKQRQHILSPPILQWAQSALCQVHGIKIHKESYCLFKFPSCIIILIHHIFNHIHHSISNRIHHSSSALIHTHLIKYIHAHTHTHTSSSSPPPPPPQPRRTTRWTCVISSESDLIVN